MNRYHHHHHHHHHVRGASEGHCVTPVPWPRRMADLHNVEGMLLVSLRTWSTHLLFGRPGRRFQSRPGRQPSDKSMWARTAWWAGTSSLSLAIWPKTEYIWWHKWWKSWPLKSLLGLVQDLLVLLKGSWNCETSELKNYISMRSTHTREQL